MLSSDGRRLLISGVKRAVSIGGYFAASSVRRCSRAAAFTAAALLLATLRRFGCATTSHPSAASSATRSPLDRRACRAAHR